MRKKEVAINVGKYLDKLNLNNASKEYKDWVWTKQHLMSGEISACGILMCFHRE